MIDVDQDSYVSTEKTSDDDTLYFYTSGAERMRILSGGSVGIGTSVPTEALTVSGNISASGTICADAFNSLTGGSEITFNDDVT